MGFAAFETMGYGLTMLLLSHGRITAVDELLFARGVLSPAGHGAWTGLICAMLWRARVHSRPTAWLAVAAAFVISVSLHALWDASTSPREHVLLALVSYGLLAWRLQAIGRLPGGRRVVGSREPGRLAPG